MLDLQSAGVKFSSKELTKLAEQFCDESGVRTLL